MRVRLYLLFSGFTSISSKKHVKLDWVSASVRLSHLTTAVGIPSGHKSLYISKGKGSYIGCLRCLVKTGKADTAFQSLAFAASRRHCCVAIVVWPKVGGESNRGGGGGSRSSVSCPVVGLKEGQKGNRPPPFAAVGFYY